ncbi:MAG: DNA polymerase III subunit delta' [Actinomycetota bacterium]|nr:DNA polymerase III subunit delta' [Actinomycetota bacterium]
MSTAVPELYADVPAQPAAVAALGAAARRPVHAYLFVGPPGTGKLAAAHSFAAALLGGTADEDIRRRVLGGVHSDVVVVGAEGASIDMDTARDITRLAARSAVEGERKVLILTDFHLVRDAGPALLKTIEEPPASAVFVILAEYLPPELVTIASRCVRVDFFPLSTEEVGHVLARSGIDPARASELAVASGGRLDRARLLASDPDFERRRQVWLGVPARLDGSGATVAMVADELVALLEGAVATIRDGQAEELAALEVRNARAMEVDGKVGRAGRAGLKTGVRDLEERHKRALRRLRTDELRSGLGTLAGAYRDRLGNDQPRRAADAAQALDLIQAVAVDLAFNLGELLMLQALLVRLGRLGT